MKETQVYSTAFVLSVMTHAAILASLAAFGGRAAAHQAAEATSYIFVRLQPPPGDEPSKPTAPPHASAAPAPTQLTAPGDTEAAPGAEQTARDPLKAQITGPRAYTTPVSTGPGMPQHGAVSSADLLSDPRSGKVFSQYFQSVRARIQTVSARQRSFIVREKGKITVDFVLNRDGALVSCEPESTNGVQPDRLAVIRALDIIHESEPFQHFPADVRADSISFNITMVFDG